MKDKIGAYLNKRNYSPKTAEILYSMMFCKYTEGMKNGLSETQSFERAILIMDDFKLSLKEVEKGNFIDKLKYKTTTFFEFLKQYKKHRVVY